MTGVWLLLEHPRIAGRSCEHCLAFQYDESTGLPQHWPDGRPMKRITLAPCRFKEKLIAEKCPPDSPTMKKAGCPKGTPENSRALSPENRQAYEHYVQCKAVGRFPDDDIVVQNAGVIRGIEDAHARKCQRDSGEAAIMLLQALTARI